MIYKSKDLFSLKQIIDKIKTKSFSVETQYKFLKLYKIVCNELAIFDEQKALLLENYGERDSEGNFVVEMNGVKISDDKVEECRAKVEELNNMEITFQDFYFSLDELSELQLSLEDMMYLEPFIKD